MTICSIDGCGLPYYGGGWCRKHHERNRKFGSPLSGRDRSRPLSVRVREKVAKAADGCWVWTGSTDRNGYGQVRHEGRLIYAHRAMFEMRYGAIPEGLYIDHRCFTPACVNPDHLRAVSPRENSEHRQGAMTNNRSTGIRNVYPKRGKWQVRVKNKSFGVYDSLPAATEAAAAARAQMFTHDDGRI